MSQGKAGVENQWVSALLQGRRMWAGHPHLQKNTSINSGEFISDQRFQHRFKIKLLLIFSPPSASPSSCSCLYGKPTGYKYSVPGSKGQEQPPRHLDLPLGLMTSRSVCQELFKAGNRSPGALNINKYLVDWFLPCFSKGNLLPGLSLQQSALRNQDYSSATAQGRGKRKKKSKAHLVIDLLCVEFPLTQPASGRAKAKALLLCVPPPEACCFPLQICIFLPLRYINSI